MSVSRRDVLATLRHHAESERLCGRVAQVCRAAAQAKQAQWLAGRTVSLETTPLTPLSPHEADTPYGNALSILDRGAQTPVEWCLLGAATALYAARKMPNSDTSVVTSTTDETAPNSGSDPTLLDDIAWLAAYTGCDAWSFLSLLDDGETRRIWLAVAQQCEVWSAPEQLALAVGLTEAGSDQALSLKTAWLEQAGHPTLLSVLETSTTSPWLDGQLRHIPGRALFLLQALTGYLVFKALGRLIGRYLLWVRQRSRVRVSPRGLEVLSHTSVLGRQFRERRLVIPLTDITDITRQTRFAGLGMYLGIACLVLGTFFGTGLIVDALRAPGTSPSLLGMGLALLLAGLLVDFVASQWARVVAGKAELGIRRRSSRRLTLTGLDSHSVNELIERLARLPAFAGSAFTSSASTPAPGKPGG